MECQERGRIPLITTSHKGGEGSEVNGKLWYLELNGCDHNFINRRYFLFKCAHIYISRHTSLSMKMVEFDLITHFLKLNQELSLNIVSKMMLLRQYKKRLPSLILENEFLCQNLHLWCYTLNNTIAVTTPPKVYWLDCIKWFITSNTAILCYAEN